MKKYRCSLCGYIYDESKEKIKFEDLPEDWTCPLCGAPKALFEEVKESEKENIKEVVEESKETEVKETDDLRKLTNYEISLICSNLARGCEKQYMVEEANHFKILAEFFRKKADSISDASISSLLELLDQDISVGFPYGNAVAKEKNDRGALRAQVWAEKVTRMLQSLLTRYEAEGDKMLVNTSVYVCTICGFVFVGDTPPDICPVCKVPLWKFEKIEGGAR